jgi:TonB family protein
MTEIWTKWQGEVINGAYPLRRFLSSSDHSGVFLTAYKAENVADAAIKIVPANPAFTEVQLSRWRTAATLSHPHLIRLFDVGRCHLGGHPFLFVVMEYAEESLSQILPIRALTAGEARETLLPTLDALAFLHRKNLVQGQLKPTNILVVNDQLKLASDTIRPAGDSATRIAKSPSVYDPPEAIDGRMSTSGDIWALGVTLVEALTRSPPEWPDPRSETATWHASLPSTFAETVRRCLSRNPAARPTVAELEARFKRAPQVPVLSIPSRAVRTGPGRAAPLLSWIKQRGLVPTIAGALVILVAVWAGVRLHRSNPNSLQPVASTVAPAAVAPDPGKSLSVAPEPAAPSSGPTITEPKPTPSPPVAAASGRLVQRPAVSASSGVRHEEIPNVPRSARATIHGRIHVAVRVTVDGSGNVVNETLEIPGPSQYFARLATAAARQWKFAPADDQDSRRWLLRFDFARDGTTGHATLR